MALMRVLGNLKLPQTVFLCCDMQEKFRPTIKYYDDIIEVAKRMVKTALSDMVGCSELVRSGIYFGVAASKLLQIPLLVTEQYPKGLGPTVSELDISSAVKVVPKTVFSMMISEIKDELTARNAEHVVLFGIETHVCIQQTVIDMLSHGLDVHVIADGVSSRSQMDRLMALERFRFMGATVTTSEAVLLQLVCGKDHEKFKEIQSIIRTSAPTSGLVPYLEKHCESITK